MIEIRAIQHDQIDQAKQVVLAVSLEIWQDILTEADQSILRLIRVLIHPLAFSYMLVLIVDVVQSTALASWFEHPD